MTGTATPTRCLNCEALLPTRATSRRRYCSDKCRGNHNHRRNAELAATSETPGTVHFDLRYQSEVVQEQSIEQLAAQFAVGTGAVNEADVSDILSEEQIIKANGMNLHSALHSLMQIHNVPHQYFSPESFIPG